MNQRFTTKTAVKAAIVAGVVLFSVSAAAAGGVLPHDAQSAISRAAEHVGIHIENPDKSAQHVDDSTSTSSTIDDNSVTSSSIDDSKSITNDDAVGHDANDDAVGHDANDDAVGHDANDDAVGHDADDDAVGHDASDDSAVTPSSIDDHGLDDTTPNTTATSVSVPSNDPAVTTSSIDDNGGANKGGKSKP